ncbi:phosphate ABC transporter permease PstA [Spirosoma flavum]|uniref:Phosphate transport system permease protein PstA n=1 Tax=Spirosoma flavum TaxID=2048557 RepID=A0ABW6AS67_9BACT
MTNPISSVNRRNDWLFRGLGILATGLGLATLLLLLGALLWDGLQRLDGAFLTTGASRFAEKAGILPALVGTGWLMILTALLAIPVGVGAGVYLEEYGNNNRFAAFLEININNLAGVPSVIYGLLGLQVFSRGLHLGASFMAGALTLSLLILPVIIVSTREALKTVPASIREASYALGATRWQTIYQQVLPAAGSGVLTGIILALSRAIGETAPLIVLGAKVFVSTPHSPFDPYTVLPLQIYNWISRPQTAYFTNAAAAIIILLLITFLLNGMAIYLRNRWNHQANG